MIPFSVAERSYPMPKVRGAAKRSKPPTLSKEQRLRGCRRVERSYFTFKVRGAAVRRYPSSKVRETQVRW